MTSALSIMALAFYKQTLSLDRDVFTIEEIETMLRASIEEAAGVGRDMEKRAKVRDPETQVST